MPDLKNQNQACRWQLGKPLKMTEFCTLVNEQTIKESKNKLSLFIMLHRNA